MLRSTPVRCELELAALQALVHLERSAYDSNRRGFRTKSELSLTGRSPILYRPLPELELAALQARVRRPGVFSAA